MYNEIQAAKSRLHERISMTFYDAEYPLRKKFGLVETPPKSAKEMLDLIEQKKYTLPSESDANARYKPFLGLQWKDPSIPVDEEGFEDALEKLEIERTKTIDEIYVLTPAEGLASLRNFETFVEGLTK